MSKFITFIVIIMMVALVAGCGTSSTPEGFNPDDLFITNIVEGDEGSDGRDSEEIPDADVSAPYQSGNGDTSAEEELPDAPPEEQEEPGSALPVPVEPTSRDIFNEGIPSMMARIAEVYGDDFIHYQGDVTNYDVVSSGFGSVTIRSNHQGSIESVYYDFYVNLEGDTGPASERVGRLVSALTGIELDEGHRQAIAEALGQVNPLMTQAAILVIDNHTFTIAQRSDLSLTVVW